METFYSKTHEWVQFADADTACVGVTAYLVQKQKDPSFINMCDIGEYLNAGESAGDIEFLKGVFDIHAPVSGTVCAVHEALLLEPEMLKAQPQTWIFEMTDISVPRKLLTAEDYEVYLRSKGV